MSLLKGLKAIMFNSCSMCKEPSTVNYENMNYCQICFMTVDVRSITETKPVLESKNLNAAQEAIKAEVENARYYMKRMTFYKDKWETLVTRYENLQEKYTKLEKQTIDQFRNKGDI